MDREAAMLAFSEFLSGTTATPDQIEFIELVVQELTVNGVMDADRLFQSPFTDINAQGPLGIFPPVKVSTLRIFCSTFEPVRSLEWPLRKRSLSLTRRDSADRHHLPRTPLLRLQHQIVAICFREKISRW